MLKARTCIRARVEDLGCRVWGSGLRLSSKNLFVMSGPNMHLQAEREFFIDNLLVRIHFIIVMIRWTGLAPGSLNSLFQVALHLPSKNLFVMSGPNMHLVWCLVFGVWCLVIGVWGEGFGVWGLEFGV